MPRDREPDAPAGRDDDALERGIVELRAMAAKGRATLRGAADPKSRLRPELFNDLFVLELANNHWGSLDRGLQIIRDFAAIVHANGVKAAIKLQFRDVETFIHKNFRGTTDLRYPKKVWDTRMPWADLGRLVEATREAGLVTMSTPFDEPSVARCEEFGVDILKIASSDIRDRRLVDAILALGRPTIMSTGGSNGQDVDALVELFNGRGVPLAINHCVSIYPSQDGELELNQVDYLVRRYPNNVIGFSTHEHTDWATSVAIAYAKGARTFERHIDIDRDGIPVSAYCSLPEQADAWFKAFNTARRMCGGSGFAKRVPPEKEVQYLDALVRGVYAKRPIAAGETLRDEMIYLAIPLQTGQMSCRELTAGGVMATPVAADGAVMFDAVDQPAVEEFRPLIRASGL